MAKLHQEEQETKLKMTEELREGLLENEPRAQNIKEILTLVTLVTLSIAFDKRACYHFLLLLECCEVPKRIFATQGCVPAKQQMPRDINMYICVYIYMGGFL